MRLDGDSIGKRVRLRTGPGDTYAEGVVYAYCEAPQVAIETDDGHRIWWRADLTEVTDVVREICQVDPLAPECDHGEPSCAVIKWPDAP